MPAAAVMLAIDLEARGVYIRGDGDDIIVGPRHLLTDDDRTAIRQLKPHLRTIAGYCPPEVA